MNLRTAQAADVDAILAFWATSAEGRSVSDDRAGVLGLIAHDDEALIIAEDDGKIVGTAIAGWDGWRCNIYRLAVRSDRRREGIASALVTAAEERFVGLGGRRSDALVLDSNADGTSTWGRLGYTREDRDRRWIKPL